MSEELWTELTLDQEGGYFVEMETTLCEKPDGITDRAFGLTNAADTLLALSNAKAWCQEHCAREWNMKRSVLFLNSDDAALFILSHDVT